MFSEGGINQSATKQWIVAFSKDGHPTIPKSSIQIINDMSPSRYSV